MASYQPPPTYADVILVDPENKKPAKFNPIWLNWFLGLTQKLTPGGAGSGTVTDVSVITANGLAGSVANSATTPAITLSTTVTGLLKGNGTAISAAASGTDYAPPTSGTSILYGNGSGGFYNVTIGTGVSFVAGTLSATGSGGTVTSVTGTAPVASSGGATPAISLNAGYGDTLNPYAAKTANYVLAGPTAGASAVPAFRALVAADIPSLTGTYVPYTGATADVDLDTFMLNAKAFHAKGTGGNGHLGLKHQSSTPSSTANESSIFADTNGNLGWLNGNKYLTTFSTSGNTANKTYTFPDTTGTVALTSDLTSYLTSVTGTAPVVSSGGTTPAISMAAATTSVSGYLTSTDWNTFNNKGSGTVTSVGWTGGIVSVATATTTPAFTVAGTSGGVPYFSSTSTWATSAALAASAIVIGGGAGAAPSTTTTGTGVVTALGVNTGSAGAFVVNGGALGTPSSGTVTNLTGTASININGTVGATTPSTGAFTTLSATGLITATGAGITLGPNNSVQTITFSAYSPSSIESYSLVNAIPGVANTGFSIRNVTDSRNELTFDGSGNVSIPNGNLAVTGALSATDTITPNQTKGIVGTNALNDAQAGSVGETVMSSSALTNYPATGTWGDLTSISLTAGDWDIAAVTQQTTPGTMTGETRLGISTTSGNSATGLTIGYNRLTFPNATSLADSGASIPMYRLQLGSTTTVYLKFFTEYSTGTPKAVGTIIARRRR